MTFSVNNSSIFNVANASVSNTAELSASNVYVYGTNPEFTICSPLPPGIGLSQAFLAKGLCNASPGGSRLIQAFPFASVSARITNAPSLSCSYVNSGSSSLTTGYTGSWNTGTFEKFSLANESINSVLPFNPGWCERGTNSAQSLTHTYTNFNSLPYSKFPHASENGITPVGNQTQALFNTTGISSCNNGYFTGGRLATPSAAVSTIQKFPFSTDANTSCIGSLASAAMGQGGNQSPTSGYSTGNTIQKFPFSTDTNATCIGALTFSKDCAAGHSSISHGYASGGWAGSWSPPLGAALCRIERFPFATDASATCVGSFSMCILGGSGHMV